MHSASSGRTEDIRMHALKAQRHLATFLLFLDGHTQPEGDRYLKNGFARTAMSLTNDLDRND